MIKEKPKTVTLNNLPQFFDFRSIGSGGIKAGMLLQFRYSSPEGVHDVKPLVFVLEKKGDRIWGLNLHYQFGIIAPLIQLKDEQVRKFLMESNEYKKYQQEISQPTKQEIKTADVPNADELRQDVNKKQAEIKKEAPKEFDLKKVRIPPDILESFVNDQINASNKLLRNYLFTRMSGLQKLSYKIF